MNFYVCIVAYYYVLCLDGKPASGNWIYTKCDYLHMIWMESWSKEMRRSNATMFFYYKYLKTGATKEINARLTIDWKSMETPKICKEIAADKGIPFRPQEIKAPLLWHNVKHMYENSSKFILRMVDIKGIHVTVRLLTFQKNTWHQETTSTVPS